jgi:transcriptional regulator with XRE-family HTH domain
MRDDQRLIGDRIRERRRALGLSQRDLGQAGIS